MSIDQPEAQRHTGDEGEGEWDDRPNAEDSAYELPESIPLDHSHPLLDPTQTQDFSPDAFLLSRRPASDLGSISKDLDLYGAQLREELVALINEDYADFVALGSGLKGEGPRISRLSWNGGMGAVHSEVASARADIRAVQAKVEALMTERAAARAQKAQLDLMLQLHESVTRLESLLLIPSQGDENETDSDSEGFMTDQQQEDQDFQEATALLLSPDGKASSSGMVRSPLALDESEPAFPASPSPSRPRRRRRSSPTVRRHLSGTSHRLGGSNTAGPGRTIAPPLLPLPQRIGRTAAEYAQLGFLRGRARAEGLHAFVDGLESRAEHIATTLRRDLRTLLSALLSPASLLLGPSGSSSTSVPSNSPMFSPSLGRGIGGAAADLEAWTPVPRPTPTTPALSSGSGSGAGSGSGLSRDAQRENENERRKEQRDWLDLALATYVALGRAKEAEEVVRSEMVKAWCEKTIHSSTLNPMMHSPVTPRTPANAWGPSVQSSPASKERGDETKPDMNLPTHGHDTERLEPLQELYHRILLFASHDIAQVCAAAETASKTALPGSALSSSPSHSPSNSRAALPSSITGTTGTQDVKDVVPRGHGIDGVQAPCDIFVNVLWDEVGRKLMDELGGTIFFVGRTEVFHKNYTQFQSFLTSFEGLAPSAHARTRLRAHPTYAAIRRRWQLPVYFQMRFREIVGKLEAQLEQPGTSLSSHGQEQGGRDQILLPATAATLEAFETPWRADIHLAELTSRSWRLSLQVLSRYKTWLDTALPADYQQLARSQGQSGPGARVDALRGAKEGGRTSMDGQRSGAGSCSPARSAVPSRSGTPTPSADADSTAADDATLRQLTAIVADVSLLERKVMEFFEQQIVAKISLARGSRLSSEGTESTNEQGKNTKEGEAIVGSLRETLKASLSFRQTLITALGRTVTSILRTRCAEPLRLVRSISTQYRSGAGTPTSRSLGGGSKSANKAPTPTPKREEPEPSYFVPLIVRPLKMFFADGMPASRLEKRVARSWAREVVEDVVNRYATSLLTMNKNLESLRRLKRGTTNTSSSPFGLANLFGGGSSSKIASSTNPGVGGGAGAGTDAEGEAANEETERIRAQMESDTRALRREVAELGLGLLDEKVEKDEREKDGKDGMDGKEDEGMTEAWQRLARAAGGSTEDF